LVVGECGRAVFVERAVCADAGREHILQGRKGFTIMNRIIYNQLCIYI
jgi:hypothetical protein